jgi:hypothetical protein
MVTPVPLAPMIWIAWAPVVAFSIVKGKAPVGEMRLRVAVRLVEEVALI